MYSTFFLPKPLRTTDVRNNLSNLFFIKEDKQYNLVLEIIKNDSLRQIERQRYSICVPDDILLFQ